ncbi:hypothetical protein [Thalassomonas haliotis]|uniref:Uncharacterized protein n=1 Tax=Thalassomonas haliotis TaxID=485448 RepID=A0ABY7V940_9GAMM|nr:hypothetical protein [Thalassomonas haliotis]WDE09847.1 hypothetical protein H3N35_16145 [Thalassomonas haliotis]
MKIPCQGTIIFMVFMLLSPLKLFALPDIDNPITASLSKNPFSYHPNAFGFSNGQLVPLEISYDSQSVKVAKNALGVRELDMSNMCHFNLVKSRLDKADISEEEFPHLYRNMELKQQQQQLEKLFPTPMQIASLSDKQKIKNSRHLFLAMNVAISPEDNSPYLIIHAKNSVQGGTFTTYLDLLLEDSTGKPLAPMQHTLEFYEGQDTVTTVIVPLLTLKQSFPGLEMIYASSYVETQALDGTITSAIKHSQYPFSWRHIEQAFGDLLNGGTKPAKPAETTTAQVSTGRLYHYHSLEPADKNRDGIIRLCLTPALPDCDYRDEVIKAETHGMTVNLPFSGQLVIPHEIEAIYPSGELADIANSGIDEVTNIYFQDINNGGITEQVFYSRDKGEQSFSDYLTFRVDYANRQSIISWNIPREQGVFSKVFDLGHQQQAHWFMTFVLKGFPYFKHSRGGGAVPFQLTLSSQDIKAGFVPVEPVLPKIAVSY